MQPMQKIDPTFTERKERVSMKHDGLHMAPGLTYCHCMCGACFMKLYWNEKHVGYCVCHACPCDDRPPGMLSYSVTNHTTAKERNQNAQEDSEVE